MRFWVELRPPQPNKSTACLRAGRSSFCACGCASHGKVALISGGGSGHEPLHTGFVGHGMLDAACPGQVFTSPTPDQIVAAAEAVETGAGMLFIVKNYAGDVMNLRWPRKCAARAPTPSSSTTTSPCRKLRAGWGSARRCGNVGRGKVGRRSRRSGSRDLGALKRLGASVNGVTRSMGVALTSCTVPAEGKPTFDIAGDEMEVGVGIHGEPGRRRVAMMRADEIAEELVQRDRPGTRPAVGIRSAVAGQRSRRDAVARAPSHV